MSKQDKYTRSARGQPCQVRIVGICKPAPENETTVLAHLGGAGIGMKNHNVHGAYACHQCHDAIDGRIRTKHSQLELKLMHFEAVIRTQRIMIDNGVLCL